LGPHDFLSQECFRRNVLVVLSILPTRCSFLDFHPLKSAFRNFWPVEFVPPTEVDAALTSDHIGGCSLRSCLRSALWLCDILKRMDGCLPSSLECVTDWLRLRLAATLRHGDAVIFQRRLRSDVVHWPTGLRCTVRYWHLLLRDNIVARLPTAMKPLLKQTCTLGIDFGVVVMLSLNLPQVEIERTYHPIRELPHSVCPSQGRADCMVEAESNRITIESAVCLSLNP